jgi:hypothetical protein
VAADHDLALGRPLTPSILQARVDPSRHGEPPGMAAATAVLAQWSPDRTAAPAMREAAASRQLENNRSGKWSRTNVEITPRSASMLAPANKAGLTFVRARIISDKQSSRRRK